MTRKERILTKAHNPQIDHSKCAGDHIEIKATPAGEKALVALGFSVGRRRKHIDYHVWHIPEGMSLEQAVEAAAGVSGVEDVEFDREVESYSLPFPLDEQGLPNDSYVNNQAGYLGQMGIFGEPSMWSLFDRYPFPLHTPIVGVKEHILDITHVDLQGQYILPPWSPEGVDPFNGDGGHSVKVAGIIGAKTGNAKGIAGLAFNSKIHMGASNYMSSTIDYVEYCITNNIKAINISSGTAAQEGSSSWQTIAKAAKDNNVVICVAAGNTGIDPQGSTNIYSFGEGVFTVAGLDNNSSKIYHGSWYNEHVTFAAPHYALTTAKNNSGTPQASDTYTGVSGTSFSAPVVTSLVALLRTINPNFTHSEIEQIIAMSCKPFVPPAGKPVYGYGIPHFRTAITIAMNNAVGLFYGDAPIRRLWSDGKFIEGLFVNQGGEWVRTWNPTAKLF